LRAVARAALANRVAERLAADRFVRDDENPPLVVAAAMTGCHGPLPAFATAEVEEDDDRAQRDEDGQPEPAVDQGPGHDQPEVADRQPDEAVCLGLAAKR